MEKKKYIIPCMNLLEIGTEDMIAFSVNTPSDNPVLTGEEGDGSDATAKGTNISIWDE